MRRLARSLGFAVVLFALAASAAAGATLEPVGSFDQPVFVTSDPVDPERLFVVEQPGRVAEVKDEAAPSPYADLTEFVAFGGERGLLSIALAPDFPESGRFYAAYTGKSTAGGALGDIHVDAFVADDDAQVTREPLISIPHSQAANHNGGQLQFGPDGYLYLSTGDGGGAGDPLESGQDLSSLLGKILRIDPRPGSSPAYAIPPGNPFAGPTVGADEIWAYGLRNPWRFSFDSFSGDMVIGDVGQREREEVDLAPSPAAGVVGGAGANYGWSCREGFLAYTDSTPSANCNGVSGFTDPIFDYPHTDPDPPADRAYGCSITGGFVVRDQSLGDLYGRYLYADYCTGEIRSLALPAGTEPPVDRSEGVSASNPVSFGEDSCHRLYVAAGGTVYRLEGAAAAVCPDPPGEEEPPKEEPPKEEPPKEEPPKGTPAQSDPPAAPSTGTPPVVTPAAKIRLSAVRRKERLVVSVRVGPCATWAGARVRLNRGGRRFASKRLDESCQAVFRMADPGRATFRAMVEAGDGTTDRSRRLSLSAARS